MTDDEIKAEMAAIEAEIEEILPGGKVVGTYQGAVKLGIIEARKRRLAELRKMLHGG